MRPAVVGTFVLCAAALQPPGLRAQDTRLDTGRITGQVVDAETGRPIEAVAVRIEELDRAARLTRADGRFTLVDVPPGIRRLVLQHIAYGEVAQDVNVPRGDVVIVTVRLRQAALALDTMIVTVQRRASLLEQVGFVRRRNAGWGRYFLDDDVEAWRLNQSLLAVPGVSIHYRGTQAFVSMRRQGFDCTPDIWLDGVRQRLAGGNVQDVVQGLDILAMEVYRGMDTPAEFQIIGGQPCGAIALWTRRS